jgi:DNA topoisomerase-1
MLSAAMPTHLVIVESPTKAKTIKRFLGKDYIVESSMGHIRDLPKSDIGIDVDGDFEPKYIIPKEKAKTWKNLKPLPRTFTWYTPKKINGSPTRWWRILKRT